MKRQKSNHPGKHARWEREKGAKEGKLLKKKYLVFFFFLEFDDWMLYK